MVSVIFVFLFFLIFLWSFSIVNINKYVKNKQNCIYLHAYVAWSLVFVAITPNLSYWNLVFL